MKSLILSKADEHGFRSVTLGEDELAIGVIGRIAKGGWIAIPSHYRNLPFSFHRSVHKAAQSLR